MKKLNILFFIILSYTNLFSQVGIGTTSPTKDLDINGELRIRNLPSTTETNILTSDSDGNIGKIKTFILSNISSDVALVNVDRAVNTISTIDNIDLGLSKTIVIPANTDAAVIITYSVPIGISTFTNPIGYYGIRFLKDGVEAIQGSRKFSCIRNAGANMVTVSNTYIENFTSNALSRSINYSLNGYIENLSSGTNHTFRFNMWNPTGSNYNWGIATITTVVYIK